MNNIDVIEEKYEIFLVEIPILLNNLQELLVCSEKYKDVKLIFNEETIKKVENYYRDVLEGKESIENSKTTINRLERIMTAFIGEAIIETTKIGTWFFNKIKNSLGYGTPMISNNNGIPINIVAIISSIKEKKENVIFDIIHYLNNKNQIMDDIENELKALRKKKIK